MSDNQTLIVSVPEEITIVSSFAGGVILVNSGAQGSDQGIELIAGAAIGGHRVITSNSLGQAILASSDNLDHAHKILGLSSGAVSAGARLRIANKEMLEEPTWQWIAGQPLFLSPSGVMAHAPPPAGFILRCGVAITATRAYIDIHQPILLNYG
jgi:hypothetical protein